MTNFLTPPQTHPSIRMNETMDLLFKNSRIHKHATNFNTSSSPFYLDVINYWSLTGNNFKKETDDNTVTFCNNVKCT